MRSKGSDTKVLTLPQGQQKLPNHEIHKIIDTMKKPEIGIIKNIKNSELLALTKNTPEIHEGKLLRK